MEWGFNNVQGCVWGGGGEVGGLGVFGMSKLSPDGNSGRVRDARGVLEAFKRGKKLFLSDVVASNEGPIHSLFIRIYFIRISRLKFVKF